MEIRKVVIKDGISDPEREWTYVKDLSKGAGFTTFRMNDPVGKEIETKVSSSNYGFIQRIMAGQLIRKVQNQR